MSQPAPAPPQKLGGNHLTDKPITVGTFPGWWMVAISATAQFMSGPGQSYSVAAFKDPMRLELGVSETKFSLAYAIATLFSGLCLPFVRHWWIVMERAACCPSSRSPWGLPAGPCHEPSRSAGLYVGFGLIRSLGQGSLTLVAMWIVGEWFTRKRGLATAISGLGGSLSVMSFPIINGLLISTFGWRSTWAMLGTLVWTALILPAVFVLRDRPEDIGHHPDGLPPEPPASAPVAAPAPPALAPATPEPASSSPARRKTEYRRVAGSVSRCTRNIPGQWAKSCAIQLSGNCCPCRQPPD